MAWPRRLSDCAPVAHERLGHADYQIVRQVVPARLGHADYQIVRQVVPAWLGHADYLIVRMWRTSHPMAVHREHKPKPVLFWYVYSPVPASSPAYHQQTAPAPCRTCLPIASASGSSRAVDLPTQSAIVERSRSMPSRA